MERDGWHKAKDAYAYDFPLDKPYQRNLRKLIGLFVKCQLPPHSGLKQFEQDCISVYHLGRTFANNWSFTLEVRQNLKKQGIAKLDRPGCLPSSGIQWRNGRFFMGLPDYNIPLKHVNGN